MKATETGIRPGRKRGKELAVKGLLFVLGRSLQTLAAIDHATSTEVAEWEEGFTVMFYVLPSGPRTGLRVENGRLRHLGAGLKTAELMILFKNLESAWMTLTPQKSIFQSFAEHRCMVAGDLSRAMSLVRCLTNVLVHLYPRAVSQRLVKRPPPRSIRLHKNRLYLFCVGIPLGK